MIFTFSEDQVNRGNSFAAEIPAGKADCWHAYG